MFDQSKPIPEMMEMVMHFKKQHHLKVAVVNNEGSELNEQRIRAFRLNRFVDFFISSCYVHFRKPDKDIFRIALSTAQVKPEEVIYLEDRPMFVQVAESLGIRGIHHIDHRTTSKELQSVLGTP